MLRHPARGPRWRRVRDDRLRDRATSTAGTPSGRSGRCGLIIFESIEVVWIGAQFLEAVFAAVGAYVLASTLRGREGRG
jgi:hypothetical protein